MPFDSPPPPDPDNRPWIDVLHMRPTDPDHCYLSESRWAHKASDDDADEPDRPRSRKRSR